MMEVYAAALDLLRHPDGPHPRRDRGGGRTGQHARHLHPGRQRRQRRRRLQRLAQRDVLLQRHSRGLQAGHAAHGRSRWADDVQPLPDRLGARDGHAVPVDEADRLALRRHAQRHWSSPGPRASRTRAASARSSTTSSTSRRPFSKRSACKSPADAQRRAAKAGRGREHGLHLRRCESTVEAAHAVFRDVRQPRPLQRRLGRLPPRRRCRPGRSARPSTSTTTSGNCTT